MCEETDMTDVPGQTGGRWSFRGRVADAGGGMVNVWVNRETPEYPLVGDFVEVIVKGDKPLRPADTHDVPVEQCCEPRCLLPAEFRSADAFLRCDKHELAFRATRDTHDEPAHTCVICGKPWPCPSSGVASHGPSRVPADTHSVDLTDDVHALAARFSGTTTEEEPYPSDKRQASKAIAFLLGRGWRPPASSASRFQQLRCDRGTCI